MKVFGHIYIYIYSHGELCIDERESSSKFIYFFFFLRKLGEKKRNGRVFVLSLEERRMFVLSIEKVK